MATSETQFSVILWYRKAGDLYDRDDFSMYSIVDGTIDGTELQAIIDGLNAEETLPPSSEDASPSSGHKRSREDFDQEATINSEDREKSKEQITGSSSKRQMLSTVNHELPSPRQAYQQSPTQIIESRDNSFNHIQPHEGHTQLNGWPGLDLHHDTEHNHSIPTIEIPNLPSSASTNRDGDMECPDCPKTYKLQRYFEQHLMAKHKTNRYKIMTDMHLSPKNPGFHDLPHSPSSRPTILPQIRTPTEEGSGQYERHSLTSMSTPVRTRLPTESPGGFGADLASASGLLMSGSIEPQQLRYTLAPGTGLDRDAHLEVGSGQSQEGPAPTTYTNAGHGLQHDTRDYGT